MYEDLRAACNPTARLLIALVKGRYEMTRRKSWVSGHLERWQCDTHMRCGHNTKVDRGHLQLRTWYIYSYDLGGIGEITSRLQRLLDACGPGGTVHLITLPLIEDSTKGGASITGEKTDARGWILVRIDGAESCNTLLAIAVTTLGGGVSYVPMECWNLLRAGTGIGHPWRLRFVGQF